MSVQGIRKNGKAWHNPSKAFRPTSGQTSYAKRVVRQAQEAETKKIEKEIKEDKEAEREVCHEISLSCSEREFVVTNC